MMTSQRKKKKTKSRGYFTQLNHALTQEELDLFLKTLFEHIEPSTWNTILSKLPNDIQFVISRILHHDHKSDIKLRSERKLQEEWQILWDEWEDLLNQIHDRGPFMTRDAPWKEPYLDLSLLIEELDAFASKLLPFLPTAFQKRLSPYIDNRKVISEVCKKIDEIPEWYEIYPECIEFGEHFTRYYLLWEKYRWENQKVRDVFTFIQNIFKSLKNVHWFFIDDGDLISFIMEFPEHLLKDLLKEMNNKDRHPFLKKELHNVDSFWYNLYLELSKEFDPSLYYSELKNSIPKQWDFGLIVLEWELNHRRFEDAWNTARRTMKSLKHSQHQFKSWDFSKELIGIKCPYSSPLRNDLIHFFQLYENLAQKTGHKKIAHQASLHLASLQWLNDWKKMIKAFNTSPLPEQDKAHYINSWIKYILYINARYSTVSNNHYEWVEWLISFAFNNMKNPESVRDRMIRWLLGFYGHKEKLNKYRYSLFLFSRTVLSCIPKKKFPFPTLRKVINANALEPPDMNSKKFYFKKILDERFMYAIEEFWRENILYFVPDPGRAYGHEYAHEAEWAKAVTEIAPEKALELLKEWKQKHHRKRNLWKALEKKGLSSFLAYIK